MPDPRSLCYPICKEDFLDKYPDLSYDESIPDTIYFFTLNDAFGDDDDGYLQIAVGDHLLFRFEIVSILGKGSFAQVVKAIDYMTEEQVAIKINRNSEIDH